MSSLLSTTKNMICYEPTTVTEVSNTSAATAAAYIPELAMSDTESVSSTESSSCGQDEESSRSEVKKQVSFDSLDICLFTVRPSDHPWCKRGPAIELAKETARCQITLDEYETRRPARRTRRQMKLGVRKREEVLVNHGFSLHEIERSVASRVVRRPTPYRPPQPFFDPAPMPMPSSDAAQQQVQVPFYNNYYGL